MKYKILADGVEIADFEFEADRDMCVDTLREAYPDAKFEIYNI